VQQPEWLGKQQKPSTVLDHPLWEEYVVTKPFQIFSQESKGVISLLFPLNDIKQI
jgi:hypothetical protein